MKIIFPYLENRIDGPEKWRKELASTLSKKNKVIEIPSNSLSFFLKIGEIKKADIIHSYNQSFGTLLILLLAKILNKKVVHTVHGNYYKEKESKIGIKKLLWLPANKMCVYLADKITFPSQYLYQEIIKKEPLLKKKSAVIPNGISIENIESIKGYSKRDLGLEKSQFLLMEVTNFTLEEKARGVDLLVKAFNLFHQKLRNSTLFIIGGGKLLNQYKYKYQTKNIRFLGFRKDVIRLIKACDFFVHSTFMDNFPYVILETMACEKPVITVNIGGIPDLVNNTVIMVDPHLREFEKKMVEGYQDESLRRCLARKALQRSRLYDWKKISKLFITLYKEM